MAFVDKRLLLSTEVCLNWVTIGATTYMSVYSQTGNYYRVYAATAGGPLTQINNRVATGFTPYQLFKKGSTLYAGFYQNNANSFQVYKYSGSGTTWSFDGYLNNAASILEIRYYEGRPFFLFSGMLQIAGFFQPDATTLLAEYGTGAIGSVNPGAGFNAVGYFNFTVIKQVGDGTPTGRAMRSFDIGPTGIFYIADFANIIGTGSYSATIYSRNGATEETLVTTAPGSAAMSLTYLDGTLYFLRSGSTNLVFSKLDSLVAPASETIIDNTTISAGGSIGYPGSAVRSAVIHDMLVVEYGKSNGSYNFFAWDTTEEDLTIEGTYTPGSNNDYTGTFTVEGDEIIFGVGGKYVTMVHQAPDDPDPEPEPEPTIEQLSDEIVIEIRKAPCNPIMLAWINSLGKWETYAFEDITGAFETEIKTSIGAEYERYVEQLDVDTTTTGITEKTITRSIRLGGDGIDKDIFVGLLDLFTSPAVDMLVSVSPLRWQRVKVSPGSIKYSETDRQLELNLELPEMFIQRS